MSSLSSGLSKQVKAYLKENKQIDVTYGLQILIDKLKDKSKSPDADKNIGVYIKILEEVKNDPDIKLVLHQFEQGLNGKQAMKTIGECFNIYFIIY